MKKIKIISILIAILIIITLMPLNALAASASVSASSTSVKVGDTVTINVTFSGKNIGVVDASFSYNSSVLQYVSGENTSNGKIILYASGSGKSSLSTSIKFKAVGSGSTTFSVSSSQIYDFDENSLGSASGSVKVTVKATSNPTSKPTSKPTNKPVKTTKPSKDSTSPNETSSASPSQSQPGGLSVNANGNDLTIVTDLGEVNLPDGAERSSIDYNGSKVDCATKYGLDMLYLTDLEGENAAFYVYKDGKFSPYVEINQAGSHIILPLPSSEKLPDGLNTAQITIDNSTFKGWVDDANNYIVYAVDSDGKKGFYKYDYSERRLIKYIAANTSDASASLSPSPSKSKDDVDSIKVSTDTDSTPKNIIEKISSDMMFAAIMGVLLILCIVMLIVFICTLAKKRKQKNDAETTGKHGINL